MKQDKPADETDGAKVMNLSDLANMSEDDQAKLLEEFMRPKEIRAPHLPYGGFITKYPGSSFGDASIGEVPFGTTPEEFPYLEKIFRAITTSSCNVTSDFLLNDVAKKIVSDETSFDLDNYRLCTSGFGFRGAFTSLLSQLVTKERPFVAYASPNWMFDEFVGMVEGAMPYSFHATSSDEFVESFKGEGAKYIHDGGKPFLTGTNTKALPALNHIAALVMVDPANPLGYRLQREHVEELEKVCLENGIVPIFDDVFRGMQKKGDRHSSSEHSHHSVVIESSSKRFGKTAYGATWTLIPNELDLVVPAIQCRGCDATAAIAVDAFYRTGYDTKISDWVEGNANAFRSGANFAFGEQIGEFRQAFPGISIMTYFLPKGINFTSAELAMASKIEMTISSGLEWVCEKGVYMPENMTDADANNERVQNALTYVRICPSKESPEVSMYCGAVLANALLTLREVRK